MNGEYVFTCDAGEKSNTSLLNIPSYVDGELQDVGYVQKMVHLLTVEKEILENLRTMLIMYEYNLQFYNVLILYFKTLNSSISAPRILQHTPNILTEPIITLLQGKKILLNDIPVRKAVNYVISRMVEFFVQKKQIKKMLVAKIKQVEENCRITLDFANQQEKILCANREYMTQEDIYEIRNHIDSEVHTVLDELEKVFVEVRSNIKIIDSFKENFISSISYILESEDVIDGDSICNLIQRSFDISSIGMVPLRILVKHIIFGENVGRKKATLLLYMLKNYLKDIYSRIAADFTEISECVDTNDIESTEMEIYKKIVLNLKPCLEHALPTKNILSVCKEMEGVLRLQFNLINKEIEYFFDKILICRKGKYGRLKRRVIEYIHDEHVKSADSVFGDYDLDEYLSANRVIESKVLSLCFQRDIIVNRMWSIRKLNTSVITYPCASVDFCLDDASNDLLKQNDCLKNTYKCIKRNINSCKPLDSDVVVILKKDIDFVDNELLMLEGTLKMLIAQRNNSYYSNATPRSNKKVLCFGMKSR